MMHGQTKARGKGVSWDDIRIYDVVLTTYGTLAAEYGRMEKYVAERNLPPEQLDHAAMSKKFPLLSPKSRFHRVILDEAQCIKNKNTQTAKACFRILATYRLCLTGTPMMNNIGELYPLILFLKIKPHNEWSRFKRVGHFCFCIGCILIEIGLWCAVEQEG
jgi:SNF2 family DNA or RNA helicase